MSNPPIIEIKDLNYSREGRKVLETINMALPRKTICGIVGPNGAGKTTLLELILGRIKADSGQVLIDGNSPQKPLQKGFRIGYLTQNRDIEREIPVSVFETVLMGRYGVIGLFKSPGKEDLRIAEESLAAVNLLGLRNRLIGKLSGGELQRVLIARALAYQPQILILDEPDAGLDVETSDAFMKLLADIRDEYGMTIILVSHDIGAVTRHADCIACLNRELHFHGKPAKLKPEYLVRTFGKDIEFLVHEIPKRCLECHHD